MAEISLKTKIQGPIAVIGDVHGQTDKLAVVLDKLKSLPDYEHRWIIFIGDFVDRGPDPKGSIDLFQKTLRAHAKTTAIAGNHEYAMCAALGWLPTQGESHWADRWVKHYNSETTFKSYGAEPGNLQQLKDKVPAEHRELLVNLPWCVEHPQLLFVHAGLDPNAPFAMQLRILHQKDFSLNRPQWLCEKSFVDADPPRDCPLTVVSGHVKVDAVEIRPKRILCDTTGGDSGDLSCVLMPERKVITSGNSSAAAKPPRTSPPAAPAKAAWWNLWG
ncbi:MAG TPA: metallophosphoesterase [Schlesneria sp.]|jgi:serine/threonine protein phosphatase 1